MSKVPMEVDNFVGIYADTSDHDLEDLIREVFDEYITNEIPIRLLYITEDRSGIRFKLVDRIFIKEHFASVPDEIHTEFCGESLEDWEDSIREEVKKRLRYAIFSHRWLSKEPTYQDMSEEVQADTPGWKKLQKFCRKTLYDHHCQFAWCDTCCINKSSSAELDESIRSMFRWYRNSHTCIAFLSETADLEALRRSQTGEGGANIDQWFLRGWTLQELLAPAQIKFYGANWQPLISLGISKNDRFNQTVMQIISGITHIPMEDLESFIPGTNRVPEKMLWASKRRTTRIEDIAYCLIGIFDVSLMISYGEGNRAFFRLMEEILKRYDKWDIFLWSGRCSRYNAALPYAPHCYPVGYRETRVRPREHATTEEERNNANCDVGDRLFTLTNHGLKIKVLKLNIELADTGGETNNSRYLTFGCIAKLKMPKVKHIGAKPKASTQWAIGVLDYWINKGGKGFLDGRQKPFTAFLLSYDKDAPDARWKKAMTEEIIKIRPTDHVSGDMASLFLFCLTPIKTGKLTLWHRPWGRVWVLV